MKMLPRTAVRLWTALVCLSLLLEGCMSDVALTRQEQISQGLRPDDRAWLILLDGSRISFKAGHLTVLGDSSGIRGYSGDGVRQYKGIRTPFRGVVPADSLRELRVGRPSFASTASFLVFIGIFAAVAYLCFSGVGGPGSLGGSWNWDMGIG
jgi:hypothetical protein